MVAYFQEAIKLLMLKYWSYMYIQQFPNNIIDVPWYLQNLMFSFQIGKFYPLLWNWPASQCIQRNVFLWQIKFIPILLEILILSALFPARTNILDFLV